MNEAASIGSTHERARGCLAGLALGDAIGRPSEGMSAAQIQDRWGLIAGFVEDEPAGSDDTEYALMTARTVLRCGAEATSDDFAETWYADAVSQAEGFRGGGFSEMAAIDNLRRGVHPPLSGQHVHGWSDGLAMRVAPLGIVAAGDPQLARRLAEADGAVSHSGEGILAGVVVAVAVAVAMAGAPIDDVVDAAIAAIPTDSWTSRNLRLARRLVASCSDSADLARTLYERLAALDYYWADLGPEAVGLAFAALIHGRGEFRASTLFAVNLGRDSDTNAAIAGCVSGALSGISTFPPEWVSQVRPVAGSCLRSTAEMDPLEVAEKLADLVTQRSVTA